MGVESTTTKVVGTVSKQVSKSVTGDLNELRKAIKEIDKAVDDNQMVEQRLLQVISRLEPCCKGGAADAYIRKLRNLIQCLVETDKILFEMRSIAKKRATKLEESKIWADEINNASTKVGKVIKVIDMIF